MAQMVQSFADSFLDVDYIWARGDPTSTDDVKRLRVAVKELLRSIWNITTTIGIDPRTMKSHALKHIPNDFVFFGSSLNCTTGSCAMRL